MKSKPIPEILAANIKTRRTEIGLTQSQLAERLEISTTYLAELEIARKSPSIEVIEKLCNVLSLRPYELFIEVGVDDSPNSSRNDLRAYSQDLEKKVQKAIKDTIAEIEHKHLAT